MFVSRMHLRSGVDAQPLSAMDRAQLSSPELDHLRSEMREVDEIISTQQHLGMSDKQQWHSSPQRAGVLLVRPSSGGYTRPASASILRHMLGEPPLSPQFPAHMRHLTVEAEPDADEEEEDDEDDQTVDYEDSLISYTVIDGWTAGAKDRASPYGSRSRPQHHHYRTSPTPARRPASAQSLSTSRSAATFMTQPPGGQQVVRPASATLHMPRPSAGLVHGKALLAPTSTRGSLRPASGGHRRASSGQLSRADSAASLHSAAHAPTPQADGAQDHGRDYFSISNHLRARSSMAGLSRAPLRRSPSGFEIGEAEWRDAELRNARNLPCVTRRRDGANFDRAPGTYWASMAAAVHEGRKPVGRKSWECVVVHPRRQQGSKSNVVSMEMHSALEGDSEDGNSEHPHGTPSLVHGLIVNSP